MARQYLGGDYTGYDGIVHHPYFDPDTGEYGEDLSLPQGSPAGAPGVAAPGSPAAAAPGPTTAGALLPGGGMQGYVNWGRDPVTIRPEYVDYLASAPRYTPGSGSYLQFPLDQPGLLTTILGQPMNARYGQGGTGDPTTGTEPQTPQEWLNGPRAFYWEGNLGQTDATRGLDYIVNLVGRPDAGRSGIATSAWSAPQQYWAGIADAVQRGVIKASPFGLQALASKGFTVAPPGGPIDIEANYGMNAAAGDVAGGSAAGAGGNAQTDALASIAAAQAAEQAARQAYLEWQMRTGDETLALQKAQQAWSQTFQETSRAWTQQYQQQQADRAQALAEAGLTGTYQGQQTQAAQQQQWAQGFQEQQLGQQGALSLLQLQSSLQGPRSWTRYAELSGSTPGGLRDLLGAFAGRYQLGGGPQGTPGPATLQSRAGDLLAPGYAGSGATGAGAQAAQSGTASQTGGLPNPWQLDLQNWQRATPAQRELALGAYEGAGYYGPDVEALLQRAAPRYTFGAA